MIKNFIIFLVLALFAPSSLLAGTWRDDFEDGKLDEWQKSDPWPPVTSEWSIDNGELVGISKSEWGADTNLYLLNSSDWQDYEISIQAKLIEIFSQRLCGVGLLIRQMDFDKYLHFKVMPHTNVGPNKARCLIMHRIAAEGFWNTIDKPFDVELDRWYNLRVKASGNNFSFYVDGERLIDHESEIFPKGEVGVALNGAKALFDNFAVKGDKITDHGPSSFAVNHQNRLTNAWGKIKSK